jgi:tetratricopeptide (TPR) repeat protein
MRRRNEKLSEELLEIWRATQEGLPVERARAYLHLSVIAHEECDFKEALDLSEIAYEILAKEPVEDCISDLLEAIHATAENLEITGEFERLVVILEKGVVLSRQYQSAELPIFLRSLGRAYHGLKNQEKSIEYHLESMAYPDPDRSDEQIGIDNLNLGMSYKLLEQYEKATEHLNIAREIFLRLKDPNYVAHVEGEFAEMYFSQKDSEKTKSYGKRALGIYQMINDYHRQWWLNYYIAVAHRIDNELDDAIKYLEKGRAIALANGWQEFKYLATVDQEMAKIYKLQGLDEAADELLERAKNVEDILQAA